MRVRYGLGLVVVTCLAAAGIGAQDSAVTFRIIVTASQDRAQELAERLARGADFAQLAIAESIDPSASRGGLIGPVALAGLREELRTALAALPVGGTSAIVRVPTGFAIVQRAAGADRPAIALREIPALAAVGSIKYTLSVDGFAESNTALSSAAKPADWNQSPRSICEARRRSMAAVTAALTRILTSEAAADRSRFTALEVIESHVTLGQLHAYQGRMAEAVEQFERAYAMAAVERPDALSDLDEMLGIAWLHKAELDNGIYHRPGERCLLSAAAGQPLPDRQALDRALAHFRAVLQRRPDHLEARWLLNVAATIGGVHPDGVPPAQVIAAATLAAGEDAPRFSDVAEAAGVHSFSSAGGVIVDDFDNDGVLEILTSNFDSCGEMQLFRRDAGGAFVDRGREAGLAGELGGLNLLQADYDNDGCKDVLVLRGGWEQAQRRSLLRNNCDGTFTDVTARAGLAVPATSSQTAVWTDIDNDGRVDLFVGNEDQPAQLFHNRGDGTFAEIGRAAGVARSAFTKGVAAADYDNDGDADLYVSNLGGGNFLFRNDGNRRFTEVAAAAGVPGPDRGFATWFFDYDNDGWQDLFVTSYYLSVEETARTYLAMTPNANTLRLYRNLGNGTFRDVSAAAGLGKVLMPMGANFGDIDNDGWLDIYLGTGSPSYGALVPSVLLRNRDGRTFADVTAASGTGEWHKGHGVAFADLDHDGDEEIVFKTGGATPGDAHAFRLFANPGSGNDWLDLRLVGVASNRAAIGARVSVTVESPGGRRTVHRAVTSGGSFGASPLRQHVGLGRDARRVDVDIWWPASGRRQRFENVPKNQAVEVREDGTAYRAVPRSPLPLARRTP